MPTEVSEFVECPRCGFYVSRYEAHTCSGRKPETFPRGPSNEQTLLTELGGVRRELAEEKGRSQQMIVTLKSWSDQVNDWKARSEAAKFHIDIITAGRDALQAERDALAVTAERYRLALLRLARLAHRQSGTAGQIECRIVADALLCDVAYLEGME